MQEPTSTLLRRLGAMCYDAIILMALLIAATWLLLPLTKGEVIPAGQPFYQLYLTSIIFAYYILFWVYGGQTVGMRAWKIKIQTTTGHSLRWKQALKRQALAILTLASAGLGLWTAFFDPQKQTLYDKLTQTHIIRT